MATLRVSCSCGVLYHCLLQSFLHLLHSTLELHLLFGCGTAFVPISSWMKTLWSLWHDCAGPWFLHILQTVGLRFCGRVQSLHLRSCLVTEDGQFSLCVPHYKSLLVWPFRLYGISIALHFYLIPEMSANFSCPSQHSPSTLPTRSLLFPSPATPSLPSKSILALLPRKILVPTPPQYPNTPHPIPLSLPCYLASLGLWIIAWLSFTANIHLQLRTCHVCLSGSELPHSW